MGFPIKVCPETSTYFPSLAQPQSKILSATPSAQGSRYFVIEGQFLLPFQMSSDGRMEGRICPFTVMHDWPSISHGQLKCVGCLGTVYPFSVWWCLELFLAADAFLFNKYLHWSMWVNLSFDMPPYNSPAKSLACELFHPAAARFAWRTFLATIVGGACFHWLFSVADAEDTGFWKDVSVNHIFVVMFLESKPEHMFFLQNTDVSVCNPCLDNGDSDGTWSCRMFSGSRSRFTAHNWDIPNPTSVFGWSISHSSCKENIKIVLNETNKT